MSRVTEAKVAEAVENILHDGATGHASIQELARRPGAGLIHHSDRGVQYASAEYRKMMQSAGFRASLSRRADCYDDAPTKSFFHTLKTELVLHGQYATRAEATPCPFFRGKIRQESYECTV